MDINTILGSDVTALAAIVAAYVGVVKTLFAGTKYAAMSNKVAPVTSIIVASAFVLAPAAAQHTMLYISLVALTATGAYHLSKPPVSK